VIIKICSIQSATVLISSFALGISLGIIATLLILMKNPIINSLTIAEIAMWLAIALIAMFISSLYPAFKFAKTSILRSLA